MKTPLSQYPAVYYKPLLVLFAILTLATVWLSTLEKTPPPERMAVSDKKAKFIRQVLPAIETVHDELTTQYQRVLTTSKSGIEKDELQALQRQYRAANTEELLVALKPHPKSLALAQAAIESAWATSRFSVEANNLFGLWSFDADEPRIAAGKKRGNETIWVKEYASINDSVRDYYLLLARGGPFSEFRKLKMKTDDPYALAEKLNNYSEEGAEYGKKLASVIWHNNFQRFDRPE